MTAAYEPTAAAATGPAPVSSANARRRMSRADKRSQEGPRLIWRSLTAFTLQPISMQSAEGFAVPTLRIAAVHSGVHLWDEVHKPFCDTSCDAVRIHGDVDRPDYVPLPHMSAVRRLFEGRTHM